MNITYISKTVPADLKAEVRKSFNTVGHATVYAKLEEWLGVNHAIYEDGTVYKVAKKLAGI